MTQILPVGKVPRDILERLLAQAPSEDPRVLLGPGIGLDCAVVEVGASLLVLKSDPITFATDAIGWYVVQVTTNDLATTGATPRCWYWPLGNHGIELLSKLAARLQWTVVTRILLP